MPKLEAVPSKVEDPEQLARRCSRKDIRWRDNTVKARAFRASKYPLDISVDRCTYCDPWEKIDNPESRAVVVVIAGDVRRDIQEADVVAAPVLDNPAHAEIRIRFPYLEGDPPATKKDMDANTWAHLMRVLEQLASLATPLPRPFR